MASRAIFASPLAVCLRCQLRSSGLSPYRRLHTIRSKAPILGLLSKPPRRWVSAEAHSPSLPPAEETTPIVAEEASAQAPAAAQTTGEATIIAGETAATSETPPPPKKRRGLPQLENRKLLILQLPTQKPRRRVIPVREIVDEEVDKLSSNLLIFEKEEEATGPSPQFAISLLKPYGVTRVSKKRYEQLYEQLLAQFNRDQLLSYVNFVRENVQESNIALPVGKSIRKGELGTIIMKEIWGIKIDEEISEREDLIIQKKIEMSKEDIYFLIGQNGRNLRKWAQEYHARITVNVPQSFVVFEAVQVNIEALEAKIPELLNQKIYEDIDLSAVARLVSFDRSYISIISRLTETLIQPLDNNIYRVSALGPSTAPIDDARRLIFDSHELQFRTSYSLLVDSSFSPGAKSSESLQGALYAAVEDKSLPWMLRGKDWARWRSVKGKAPALPPISPQQQRISSLIEAATPSLENPKPSDRWERFKADMEATEMADSMEQVRKLLDLGTSTSPDLPPPVYSATFGYVLHNSPTQLRKLNTLASVLEGGPERVFCENIPGLTYIISGLSLVDEAIFSESWGLPIPDGWSTPVDPESTINWETGEKVTSLQQRSSPKEFRKHTLVLKFSPSPWSHPDTFETHPPVELTLEIDPITGNYSNPKLVAIHSNSVADLMLPSRECDVRFRRRVDVPLYLGEKAQMLNFGTTEVKLVISVPPAELQESLKGVVEQYLAESKLNPLTDNRLQPAPEIELLIPKNICAAPSQSSSDTEVDAREERELEHRALVEEEETTSALEGVEEESDEILEEALSAGEEADDEAYDSPALEGEAEASKSPSSPTITIDTPSTNKMYVPVTYLFTSLSYRTTTAVNHTGYRVNKTLIEGGISGGKKTEITVFFQLLRKPAMLALGKDPDTYVLSWSKWTEDVLALVGKMGEKLKTGGVGPFTNAGMAKASMAKTLGGGVDLGRLVRGIEGEKRRKRKEKEENARRL